VQSLRERIIDWQNLMKSRKELMLILGNMPVSIKPYTYEVKGALPEHIDVKIIYYKLMMVLR
jgi:hypothetical protein